jgi:NAD(P)-dependent dehydrogenase (short-subunit alcohol dehydrogenase family)
MVYFHRMKADPRFNLTGKLAVVTGATRGIGRAIAFQLGHAGASVVVSSRKPDAVNETVNALTAEGISAKGFPANVGRLDDARALIEFAAKELGAIDILVNNAAVSPLYGPLTSMTEAAFDKIMDVNVKAPLELAVRALPHMTARGGGSIVNLSSVDGIRPDHDLAVYSASKAALISLTKAMALEWGTHNVRANAICPGLIKTDFSAAMWKDNDGVAQQLAKQPLPRLGTPEDVAGLALFLASDAGSYCTGGVYLVDGGWMT